MASAMATRPWQRGKRRCDERGKVIDDGTVTRLDEDTFRWTAADPSLRWLSQNAIGLEPDNQILAATLDRRDALALELSRHLGRLVRTHEARVVDRHPLEAPADERGLKLPADGLDLRQLRHAARVVGW